MEITKRIDLFYTEGGSDKVYNTFIKKDESGHHVEFSYGRKGNAQTHGTKTPKPVTEAEAEKIFNKLVSEKKGKGYREIDSPDGVMLSESDDRDTGVKTNKIVDILLQRDDLHDEECTLNKLKTKRPIDED